MTDTVTLERVDGAQNFTWSYGYETYKAENGVIVVPVEMVATIASGYYAGEYQVAQQKPPAPKKKVTPKSEDSE